jgi:hypothetical protein
VLQDFSFFYNFFKVLWTTISTKVGPRNNQVRLLSLLNPRERKWRLLLIANCLSRFNLHRSNHLQSLSNRLRKRRARPPLSSMPRPIWLLRFLSSTTTTLGKTTFRLASEILARASTAPSLTTRSRQPGRNTAISRAFNAQDLSQAGRTPIRRPSATPTHIATTFRRPTKHYRERIRRLRR